MLPGCAEQKQVRRRVSNVPNAVGEIELGPMRDARGMGDILTVTPCADRLPNAVLLLPPELQNYGCFFDGLCPVRITNDYPEFPFCADRPVVESNLAIVGIAVQPGVLPIVKLTQDEKVYAYKSIKSYPNPVAIVPTCSRQWTGLRAKPSDHWGPIVAALRDRHTVLQFGYPEFPDIKGAVRMDFPGYRRLAALYSQIGRGVMLNTGDYHLMLAVGGKCVVLERPEREMPNMASIWKYNLPNRVRYPSIHSHAEIIGEFQWMNE